MGMYGVLYDINFTAESGDVEYVRLKEFTT